MKMPKAAASTRSSGRVNLVIENTLVNIPVAVYTGTVSDAGVTRHQYLPVKTGQQDENGKDIYEDHPVGNGQIDKIDGHLLTADERARIAKKIDTEYGPVYVEDNEIEKLFTLDANTLVIKEFEPQHIFHQGHYVPKTLNFIEPDKTKIKGKNQYMPVAAKLLATLLEGMRKEGVIAVGELTTRGVPKPCILTADGALWQVYHTDAVREQRELPETETKEGEVTAMRGLIAALLKTEPADLSDFRSDLIQNFANEKARNGDFSEVSDDYTQATPAEPTIDLMAMLQASIDAAKAV
jgi:non-homologous end joining protein Ku